ncbi:MAG: heterodisulfide reductase subunit A [Kiritimatiellaeota bacterium]|nr:heterodisulfide reductase subunit A [Kiritimatiellota bacterium]
MTDPREKLVVGAGWQEKLVDALHGDNVRVLAPVLTEGTAEFREISAAAEMATEWINTRTPVKAVLFPRTEALVEFERRPGEDVQFTAADNEAVPTVVLGARPCDLNALDVLDTVFNWDYRDKLYAERRAATTFVGVACTRSDEACFCTGMGGRADDNEGSDLFVRPMPDGGAVLEVMNERGAALAKRLDGAAPAVGTEELVPPAQVGAGPFDTEKVKEWLDTHFDDDFWTDMSLKCLGCGACSYLCPTCHCFDIVDESDWRKGQRRRNWDCCSFAQFTKHASGHNPRPEQHSRCRNRIMHKFKYFIDRFGRKACVGCGRCIRVCGAGQDLVDILAEITTAAS